MLSQRVLKTFYKIIKKVLTNEITYAIMMPETRERYRQTEFMEVNG